MASGDDRPLAEVARLRPRHALARGQAALYSAAVELTQLRYFLTAVRTGSISAAARQLGLTQPALSQQIRKLEMELGARLLDRQSRRLTLTVAGDIFLPA